MDILKKIMAERKADVAEVRRIVSEETLLKKASTRQHHSLKELLRGRGKPCIIAEIKKASPSAGMLRIDYRPAEIARSFQESGATGISVLTEPRHFLGSEGDFLAVRSAVDIPLLRKDFLCDAYQVYESAAWGADVVLLIVAALDKKQLQVMNQAAREMNLDVIVEAHKEEEVWIALELENAIIGVNSRDLKKLKTDLSVARRLAVMIPHDRLSVAESGIKEKKEIKELFSLGYNGFLIGETLMRDGDPRGKLSEFAIENG